MYEAKYAFTESNKYVFFNLFYLLMYMYINAYYNAL